MKRKSALIRADELREIMNRPDVKILDCSYGLPAMPVRIGNAVDFDIDKVADPDTALPHTLPSPEVFAQHAGHLGISNNDTVVVYDRAGMHMAAARVWWMFRIFGHDNVKILDGGLPAWIAHDFQVLPKTDAQPAPTTFKAGFRPEMFKQKKDIQDNIGKNAFAVIDARDPKRYSGDAPEPRPGMEGGHIPGAHNIFFATLIDNETGLFRPLEQVSQIIGTSGVDTSKPMAVSCGSGVTACVIALGLYEAGIENAAIYGGSWAEWGGDPALPKTKGDRP